jgi:hypothetical protein
MRKIRSFAAKIPVKKSTMDYGYRVPFLGVRQTWLAQDHPFCFRKNKRKEVYYDWQLLPTHTISFPKKSTP